MSITPVERTVDDAMSEARIAEVFVDIIRIAPKKAYSMAGQDYAGQDYYGLLVRIRTEDGVEGIGEVFITPGWYGASPQEFAAVMRAMSQLATSENSN